MPRADLNVHTPFTRADALAAGIGDRKLAGPAYRRIFPGVYVASIVPDTLVVRSKAALLAAPSNGVVSHHTAARLFGATVPESPNIHVSYARDAQCLIDGIKVHRFRGEFATARYHGVPVTSPIQTLIHLARPLDLVDVVGCADGFVRRKVISPEELVATTRASDGQGARLARRAAELTRDHVDSINESRVRLLMVLAGLPEPVVNHRIVRPDGSLEYKLDLSYPDVLLAIEYDGRWHDSPEQRAKDAVRRATLAARGWHFEVLTADDLFETPEETLCRLHGSLRAHGIPAPAVLRDEWRQHFAVRGPVG
jgi:hypothetical protein